MLDCVFEHVNTKHKPFRNRNYKLGLGPTLAFGNELRISFIDLNQYLLVVKTNFNIKLQTIEVLMFRISGSCEKIPLKKLFNKPGKP